VHEVGRVLLDLPLLGSREFFDEGLLAEVRIVISNLGFGGLLLHLVDVEPNPHFGDIVGSGILGNRRDSRQERVAT